MKELNVVAGKESCLVYLSYQLHYIQNHIWFKRVDDDKERDRLEDFFGVVEGGQIFL